MHLKNSMQLKYSWLIKQSNDTINDLRMDRLLTTEKLMKLLYTNKYL
jgi:hypothetical protein